MDFKYFQSQLLTLWQSRNSYLCLSVALLLVNFIQTITIISISGNSHTIIVPANLSRSFWVNQSTVSNEYLAQMTEYFSTLILDITPDNAKFQRETLLQYVEPSGYGALKNQLIALEDKAKIQTISTSFYPVNLQVDHKHLTAIITGDLKTFVGETLTSTQRQSYLAKYSYRHGRLLLQQFSEVKKDAA